MQEDGVGGAALGGTTAKKRGGKGRGPLPCSIGSVVAEGRRRREAQMAPIWAKEGGLNGDILSQKRTPPQTKRGEWLFSLP